jgi:hypothetical protein
MLKPGTIVEMDGLLAVVVAEPGDEGIPEDHVALWFGSPQTIRASQGGTGVAEPEVWTVPVEYCSIAKPARIRH